MTAPLSPDEIKKMRKACRLAADTLIFIEPYVKIGITTLELNDLVEDFTKSHGARSGPLGYHGYPKSICTSVNNVVCHGVPNNYKLKDGDIINVDVSPVVDGFFGDTSATYMVGKVSDEIKLLVETAKMARDKGIEAITPNGHTGDIGFAIDKFVTRRGFTTVKEIGGHGIGRIFHGEPFIPSYGKRGKGELLRPWHCITVEPMVNQGSADIDEKEISGSSHKEYITLDGKLSAQFEHTILITDTGYEVLTLP
jgi:methionyl aminopeptidase